MQMQDQRADAGGVVLRCCVDRRRVPIGVCGWGAPRRHRTARSDIIEVKGYLEDVQMQQGECWTGIVVRKHESFGFRMSDNIG